MSKRCHMQPAGFLTSCGWIGRGSCIFVLMAPHRKGRPSKCQVLQGFQHLSCPPSSTVVDTLRDTVTNSVCLSRSGWKTVQPSWEAKQCYSLLDMDKPYHNNASEDAHFDISADNAAVLCFNEGRPSERLCCQGVPTFRCQRPLVTWISELVRLAQSVCL